MWWYRIIQFNDSNAGKIYSIMKMHLLHFKFTARPDMNSLTKIQKLWWLLGMGRQMSELDNAT